MVGDRLLARPAGGEVVLERDLDDHPCGDPRRLGEHRNRVGNVLEHVGEHRELECPRAVGQGLAVVPADVSLRTPSAGEIDRSLGDLDAREAPRRLAPGQLGDECAVTAADVEYPQRPAA